MNHGPLLFLGVFLAVAASWFASVVGPPPPFGDQEMVPIEATGQSYPLARSGEARQGADVYRANGCFYCHTQQIRAHGEGADILRHWGVRRTVARDYLRDEPVMLGSLRLGPDLANIGTRQTNSFVLLLKLYNPRIITPGSSMPRYPYLFEERKLRPGQAPSPEALPLTGSFAPPPGYEVVPRPEAHELLAYLASLKADTLFFEVFPTPPPGPATNQVALAEGATNAPPGAAAAGTNAIAATGTNAPAAVVGTNAPAAK